MSSKSAAHPESHGHTLFSKKFIIIAGVLIVAVFFITISYYPLLFNSNNNSVAPAQIPHPVVK